jgi:DNA helicase-2/ATP-dependent DNA helicase PcrA
LRREQLQSLRNPPENAVALSTIHSAKGLEWHAVFMVAMEDGVLPHTHSEDVEEERPIAYVGMTRARRLLGLTYAVERYNEKARSSGFLREIGCGDERLVAWTSVGVRGADARLPLLRADDARRPTASTHRRLAPTPSWPPAGGPSRQRRRAAALHVTMWVG